MYTIFISFLKCLEKANVSTSKHRYMYRSQRVGSMIKMASICEGATMIFQNPLEIKLTSRLTRLLSFLINASLLYYKVQKVKLYSIT